MTTGDIGGCGCGHCDPCPLPATDLHLSWQAGCNPGTGVVTNTGTATVAYQGVIGGVPTWQAACSPSGLPGACFQGFTFLIQCDPIHGTLYKFSTYISPACAGAVLATYSVNGTTGANVGGLTIASHNCSPLNITFGGGPTFAGSVLTL